MEESPTPIDGNSTEQMTLYENCERSSHMSLMIMKPAILDIIKGIIIGVCDLDSIILQCITCGTYSLC